MNYITEEKVYYRVVDKDSGEFITVGELEKKQVLSTIHIVSFISKEEYDDINEEQGDGFEWVPPEIDGYDSE